MKESYFKPKWTSVHCKAIEEFEKDPRTIEAKTIEDIVSVFFK